MEHTHLTQVRLPDNPFLTLATREFELCAPQNQVPRREKIIGLTRHGRFPEIVSNIYLTPREKEIVTLLRKELSRLQICELLNITREALRKSISRIWRKRNFLSRF